MEQIKQNSSGTRGNGGKHGRLNYWTIMIYHSGDSDLGEEFVWAMKEMVRVGTPDRIEVVALMDSVSPELWQFSIPGGTAVGLEAASRNPTGSSNLEPGNPEGQNGIFYPRGIRTHAKVVSPNGIAERAHATRTPAQKDQPTRHIGGKKTERGGDMASPELLKSFVENCVAEHPALHYMLVLSGHGSGIIGRTLLLDRGAGSYMSVSALNSALHCLVQEAAELFKSKQAGVIEENHEQFEGQGGDSRLDILGFDACVMMTAEVAHLLKDDVKYLVASEGYMTMTGWPYYEILEFLKQEPSATPEQLATAVVRKVIGYYTDYARVGLSVDLAACRLDPECWAVVASAIKRLSGKLRSKVRNEVPKRGEVNKYRPITNAVIAAHWYAQSYASEEYVDLYDFCEQLMAAAPEFKDQCRDIIDGLEPIIANSCYAGAGFQHSHGVSLYFPWVATHEELDRYMVTSDANEELSPTHFQEETEWGTFLRSFIDATRREVRPQDHRRMINMPPEGYYDHIPDLIGHRNGVPSNTRNGVPSNTRNGVPSNTRGKLVSPKVKNPALFCYEDERQDVQRPVYTAEEKTKLKAENAGRGLRSAR